MELALTDYIKPELLALVAVLYLIGIALKKNTRVRDENIPTLLGAVGILLALLWVLGSASPSDPPGWFAAIFTAIVQGTLVAGASVYCNQLVKQAKK